MMANVDDSDSSAYRDAKLLNQVRVNARSFHIPEGTINNTVPSTHTYQIKAPISGNASSVLTEFEGFGALTTVLSTGLKKYRNTKEYRDIMSVCRILPLTHYYLDVYKVANAEGEMIVPPVGQSIRASTNFSDGNGILLLHSLRSRYRLASKASDPENVDNVAEGVDEVDANLGNLYETVNADRRVTSRNTMKWSQQLLCTLLNAHHNYITVGDFGLSDVFLDSDVYVTSALEKHHTAVKNSRVEGTTFKERHFYKEIEKTRERNAWLDIHNKVFPAPDLSPVAPSSGSPTKTPSKKTVKSKSSVDQMDHDGSASSKGLAVDTIQNSKPFSPSNEDKLSPSKSGKTQPATSSAAVGGIISSSLEPLPRNRLMTNLFNREWTQKCDNQHTGCLTVRGDDPLLVGTQSTYNEYLLEAYKDMRCLGIVLLQLISHRIFEEKELRALWSIHPLVLPTVVDPGHGKPVTPHTPAVGSPNKRSTHSAGGASTGAPSVPSTPSGTAPARKVSTPNSGGKADLQAEIERYKRQVAEAKAAKEKEIADHQKMLSDLENLLVDRYEHVARLPAELKELVVLCFQPFTPVQVTVKRDRENVYTTHRFVSGWMMHLQQVSNRLQSIVLQQYNDVHYEKPIYWTEEDEKRRLAARKQRMIENEQKIEQGVITATHRIRRHRYEIWYSLQPEDYRRRMEHYKKAKILTQQHKEERKRLLYIASLHIWPLPAFETWMREAFVSYCRFLINLKAQYAKNKKKKPEFYVQRLLSELFGPLNQSFTEKIIARYGRVEKYQQMLEDAEEEAKERKSRGGVRRGRSRSRSRSRSKSRGASRGASSASGSRAQSPTKGPSLSAADLAASVEALNRSNSAKKNKGRPKNKSVKLSKSLPALTPTPSSTTKSDAQNTIANLVAAAVAPKKKVSTRISEGALLLNIKSCVETLSKEMSQLLISYMRKANDICSAIRKGEQDAHEHYDKNQEDTLIINDDHLFHQKMAMQADTIVKLTTRQFKKAMLQLCEEIGTLDRDWSRDILYLFWLSVVNRYHKEIPIRLQGENIAACKITAFFQMIRIRKLTKLIWEQTDKEYVAEVRASKGLKSRHKMTSKSFAGGELPSAQHPLPQQDDDLFGPSFSATLNLVMEHHTDTPPRTPGSTRGSSKRSAVHRSFAVNSDAQPRELLHTPKVLPHVDIAPEVHTSIHEFEHTLEEHQHHLDEMQPLPKIHKTPMLSNLVPDKNPNYILKKQREPLTISGVSTDSSSVQVDLAVNLVGDAENEEALPLPKTAEKKPSNKFVNNFDFSKEYYKFDDWKTVTCSAFLVLPASTQTTAINQVTNGMFISTVAATNEPPEVRYSTRNSTLPVLRSDVFIPDKLFTEARKGLTLHNDALSVDETAELPSVPDSSIHSHRDMIIVLYSRKQVLYNLYAKTPEEFKSHPEKYKPVEVELKVKEAPLKAHPELQHPPQHQHGKHVKHENHNKTSSAAKSNHNKGKTGGTGMGEDRDYSLIEMSCRVLGLPPNCTFSITLQLDQYLAEDLCKDHKHYFDHLHLLDTTQPTAPVPFIDKRALVWAKPPPPPPVKLPAIFAHLDSTPENPEDKPPEPPDVYLTYTHSGETWHVGRPETDARRLVVLLPEKVKSKPAPPQSLTLESAQVIRTANKRDASASGMTVGGSNKTKKPKLAVYFKLNSIPSAVSADDLNLPAEVLSSFTSFIKVAWERSFSDRPDKTFYHLQRKLTVWDENSAGGSSSLMQESGWVDLPVNDNQLHHNHNYFTDSVSLAKDLPSDCYQGIVGHFVDHFAELAGNGEGEWLECGVTLRCSYRVRAINSFGTSKYSRASLSGGVMIGSAVMRKSDLIQRGYYQTNKNQLVIKQLLTSVELSHEAAVRSEVSYVVDAMIRKLEDVKL